MAGLNDRRRLGTESGRIRRAARQVARDGGNPNDLINLAAKTKLSEGSAISSSEDNIAFEKKKRLTQSGLMEGRRRATLGGDSAQKFNADIDRSALVKTDSAARQRAYDRGAALGVSREDIDQRAGTLQGTTSPVTGTTPPVAGTTPPVTGTSRPTLQGPPASAKPGLIDGKPARSVIDSMRGTDTEPGNLADLQARDAKDRESAITAARTESEGNPSVTRSSVIDRLNKERVAGGRQPFGEDIYKDIAKQDGEAAKQTPLQKSLADARTRFAPAPENTSSGFQGGLPVPAPLDTSNLQVPPSLFGGAPPEPAAPSLAQTKPQGLGASLLQDAKDVFNLSQVIPRTARSIVQDQLTKEAQVIPKFMGGLEDSVTAVKKASKTAGNSLLSRAPGATGSYLRNRFAQPR